MTDASEVSRLLDTSTAVHGPMHRSAHTPGGTETDHSARRAVNTIHDTINRTAHIHCALHSSEIDSSKAERPGLSTGLLSAVNLCSTIASVERCLGWASAPPRPSTIA